MPNFFLLFSHIITDDQIADARRTLYVRDFIPLPEELQTRWSDIPPELETIETHLQPVFTWLLEQAQAGDYLLVQGDFGAVSLTVAFARKHGLVPVYSTTARRMVETYLPNGTVQTQHTFQHVRYRKYQS